MYTAKGRLDANAMIKQYSPLVRRLAHQMIAKLPANVELDDLIQVGMIGLSDALSRFDRAGEVNNWCSNSSMMSSTSRVSC